MQREDSHVSGMTVYEPLEGAGQMCPAASSRGRLCATATGHFRPADCEKANSHCFRLLPGVY